MAIRFDFSDQVAVVSGAASGIGRAVSVQIAASGGIVFELDKRPADGAPAGGPIIRCQVDVTERDQVAAVLERAFAQYGRIDVVVNSAGISGNSPFLETTDDLWTRIIDLNLRGTFVLSQVAARYMSRRRYGRIVNLSSVAAFAARPGRAAYGASKGGVIALTRSMAMELAEHAITVNAVAPGATDTELVAATHDAATRKAYSERIPLKRYATPDEIAWTILYLASREAGYVSGQTIAVDGGLLAAGVTA
ncbi:MAG: SDR family oxidoreductase [Pseudomonadota bacterium]|nr:SDR family oxidoreductase [Pseudomonadota bacterium]